MNQTYRFCKKVGSQTSRLIVSQLTDRQTDWINDDHTSNSRLHSMPCGQSFDVMSVDRRVPSVIRLVGSTLVQRNNKMTATEGVRRVEQLGK